MTAMMTIMMRTTTSFDNKYNDADDDVDNI